MTRRHSDKLDEIDEINELGLLEVVPVLIDSIDDLLTDEEKYGHLLLRNEDLKAVYNAENQSDSGRMRILLTDKRIISVEIPEYVVEYDLIDEIRYLRMNQKKCWIAYETNIIKFDTEKETVDFYRRLLPSALE